MKLTEKKTICDTLTIFLFVTISIFSNKSYSATLELVQVGTVTISGTAQTVPISAVTDNKSILIFNLTTHSTTSGPQDTHIRGQLNCLSGLCDEINFARYGSGDSVTIRWQVMEFTDASGVNIQRGIETHSNLVGNNPANKTITTNVNTANSFVLLSEFVHGTVTSDDDFTRGQINATGNLVLSVEQNKTIASHAEIAWQVVEYQDANIQNGDLTFNVSESNKTTAINAVDLNKSWLVYNYYSTGKAGNNPVCQNVVKGSISNTTTLQFDRGCANKNGSIHLSWFLIEFTDSTTVQHNSLSFNQSDLSKAFTLNNSVNTNCAITTTGYHQRGGQSTAVEDHTSSAWFNASLNAGGTEITLERGQTNNAPASTGWFVIEFGGCASTTLTIIHKVVNDDAGILGGSDFAIITNVGSLVFDAGGVSGDTTTYTSNPMNIATAGAFNLVAPSVNGYAQTASWWTCSGDGSHALSTTNSVSSGTLTGIVTIDEGDSVTCTVIYDDNPSCSALSGEVNVATSPISILRTESGNYKNKLFVATTNHSANTGNVNAYAIGSDELPLSSPSWNAAGAMATQNQRGTRLFTSVVSGQSSTLVAFNSSSLTNDSFLSSGVPDYQTIKTNVASAAMGRISPNSNITLLQDEVNPLRFLAEPDYRSFYTATISNRSSATGATVPTQVLVTSDDGFLYSFNQSSGDLNWGWMPPSLALELKHAAGFADQHYMQGEIDQLDLKSGTTGSYSFDSYIAGSYRNGLGQYVLKIANNSGLTSVVWDTDHTLSNVLADTTPNQGKRAYFSDANGIQYMAYIITSSGTDSVLHIRSLVDDNTHVQITLGFTATSTPFVMPDLLGSASPAVNTIYLGSDNGNVYAATLFANDNVTINSNLGSVLYPTPTPVSTIHDTTAHSSSAILYMGASVAVGGKYHLHAQAEDRFTVFTYDASGSTWNQSWTTSTAANLTGKWITSNGTSTFGTDNSITPLPANSRLTDEAYIIANSIVLPVTETSADANACYGDAYYYFYKLPTGYKPVKTFFYTSNHTAITTGKIRVGKGDAMSMHLTTTPVAKKLVALGLAGQDVNSATGVSQSFYVNDPVTSGIRSWKELH